MNTKPVKYAVINEASGEWLFEDEDHQKVEDYYNSYPEPAVLIAVLKVKE